MSLFCVGDGQVDFEEFVTLLGPKLTAAGMPDKFNGTDFDSVFWKVIYIPALLTLLVAILLYWKDSLPDPLKP